MKVSYVTSCEGDEKEYCEHRRGRVVCDCIYRLCRFVVTVRYVDVEFHALVVYNEIHGLHFTQNDTRLATYRQ